MTRHNDPLLGEAALMHANCVSIAGHGLLIRGDAGSGKTSFSLLLIRRALHAGLKATLLADDQTLLMAQKPSNLIAMCPEPIVGLVEVRPYGVVPHGLDPLDKVRIDLIVDLADKGTEIERVQQGDTVECCGIIVSALKLPWYPQDNYAAAVFVALGLPAWY